jgi:flagellar protein FliS
VSNEAHDAYLVAQIRTATPQRLRLMLIEGALRHARQVLQVWQGGALPETAYHSLVRCRDIVTELYAVIKPDESPVARQVAQIYLYLFRLLAEASLTRDPQHVRDAVRVLEQERENWRQVCEKMPEPPAGFVAGNEASQEITAGDTAAIPAALPIDTDQTTTNSTAGGLSLEA